MTWGRSVREFLRRGVVPERSKAAGKIVFARSVHEVIPWADHVTGITLFVDGGMLLYPGFRAGG